MANSRQRWPAQFPGPTHFFHSAYCDSTISRVAGNAHFSQIAQTGLGIIYRDPPGKRSVPIAIGMTKTVRAPAINIYNPIRCEFFRHSGVRRGGW
jgi:hypothetical protein